LNGKTFFRHFNRFWAKEKGAFFNFARQSVDGDAPSGKISVDGRQNFSFLKRIDRFLTRSKFFARKSAKGAATEARRR